MKENDDKTSMEDLIEKFERIIIDPIGELRRSEIKNISLVHDKDNETSEFKDSPLNE